MRESVHQRWFWALWLIAVVALVSATAAAEQLGPVIHPEAGAAGEVVRVRVPPRPFAAVKKKTKLAPGEAKLDLNSATADELVTLPGIGRKRAEQIVALRGKRPFRRVSELRRVRGIGKKTLQRLLPLVTVAAPPKPKGKLKVKVKAARAKPARKPRA